MKFETTGFDDVVVVTPEMHGDERGAFGRIYCEREFEQAGINFRPVQINHSINKNKGTIRGMHFQYAPHAEGKFVKCISGRIQDVIIDIRKGSSTFLQHYAIELSEENLLMLYVPPGFAHGFQTLEDNSNLIYMASASYAPSAEDGLHFQDPRLNLKWPLSATEVSERDKQHRFLDTGYEGINL